MCSASMPEAPPPPPPPQTAKQPTTAPLKRRNQQDTGGMAIPEGSTMLTGISGIEQATLNVGSNSLLGGGRGG